MHNVPSVFMTKFSVTDGNVHRPQIWAMGGGKGGVGKSFIVSNLAISLARIGKKAVVVDLDLGAANIHTCLGCDIPTKTLSDFLNGRVGSLAELVNPTPLANLFFISGANDSVRSADIDGSHHDKLLRGLLALPFDYVLLDLGAGTHERTLDYFLLADRPLIGVTPEPTSIENAYRFIKSAYYRHIRVLEARLGLSAIVDHAMDHKNQLGIKTPFDLVNKVVELNPTAGIEFRREIEKFELYLIINQIRTMNDVDIGTSIQSVCKKYFGININYVGYLDYDNAVWQSVRKRRPLILEHPHSLLVHQFGQLARALEIHERPTRTNILRTARG